MSKIFAIADIHGCYDTLIALMKKLPLDKEKDTVVFMGDYVDRGPKTKQVIDQMIEWEKQYPHWKFLYGNHEDLMLDALIGKGQIYHSYDLWWGQGGRETFESYIPPERTVYEKAITQVLDVIPAEHIDWLRTRAYYFDSKDYFFVHAGIPKKTSLEDFKTQIDNGDATAKYNSIWIRDEFIDSVKDWGKKIIFGHTADGTGRYNWKRHDHMINPLQPIIRDNKIGIDCAVCPPSAEKLCAIELPSEEFYFQESID